MFATDFINTIIYHFLLFCLYRIYYENELEIVFTESIMKMNWRSCILEITSTLLGVSEVSFSHG